MIQDRLVSLDEVEHLIMEPIQRADPHTADLQPGLNSMMRCPLPPVNVTPDTTRQFYRGGMLPQIRVMSPPPAVTNGGTGGGSSTVGVTSSSSSSSVTLTVQQTAITTQVLNPNQIFNGSLSLGKVVDFVQISSSLPCRVRLYGSQLGLNLDTSRPLDVAPAFGIEQGLVLDAVLDTAPYTISVEGVSGSNCEQPQKNLIYIAVTNVGNSSSAIVVTLSYVTLVS